jgi:K+-sensing histidine kinase KdpD
MTDVLGPLWQVLGVPVANQYQEDARHKARLERRRQIMEALKAIEATDTFSDVDLQKAISVIEDLSEVTEIVLGDPSDMGPASYDQFVLNCRLLALGVMAALGKKRIPREPTREMIAIGAEKFWTYDSRKDDGEDMAARMWRFMYDEAVK